MNKQFILFFLFVYLICNNTIAQENKLSSRFRPGLMWFYTGVKPAEIDKVRKYDRLIVDLVYNDWTGKKTKAFKNNIGSIGLNTSLLFDIQLAPKNKISFGVGATYSLFKINQNDFFIRNGDSSYTTFAKDISLYGIEKSVFKIHSFGIPLELRFRGANWKHFKFIIGGKIAYQFLATTVLSSKNNGIVSKNTQQGFYDFQAFSASAHLRVGIRNWALFASYNFLPFFKSDKSVQLNGFQIGLGISLF